MTENTKTQEKNPTQTAVKIKSEINAEGFELLQDFVDHTSEIIILLSTSGDFLFANNAFKETTGYNDAELLQFNIRDILHPQYEEEVLTGLDEVRNGASNQEFQMVIRSKEKKRVYLLGDVNCRYVKGEPVSFRCLLKDISQRRRAERAQNLYYSIAQSNLNTPNLQEFLKQVHLELQKNIFANNFFVAVYEPEDGSIYFPYHVDEYYEKDQSYIRRKLGNGLIEYSMVQNKPLMLNKADLEALMVNEKIFIYGSVLPAVQMMVPLRVNDKTTGVIGIKSYSDENKFNSRDLELLEFVSGQVALALSRKKSEENLLLQTARLNALFDSSSHFIWTVTKKRQLSSFNKNYYDLINNQLGVPPQIGASVEKLSWKLISSEDRPSLRERYTKAFEGEPQYFEMHWGSIDGGNDWYEFYLNPILSSEKGDIEEVSGIARNITEKKIAVLSIQKSEEKFRNIIESFIDIYYRTDLAGNVTMISPSVLKHTGYSLNEVLGKKVDKFFENAQNSSQDIKSLLKTGSITNFEVNVKRKDGELRQFMLNIRMVKDRKGIPIEVEGVARDISELKKGAEELKLAKDDAEYSLKIKEQFLANMSHEIRTPMNGIIGMIDVLNETPLKTDQKDYVQTIKKSSQTLLTILNDILDLSKIEAGKMELNKSPLDLKDILDNLVALFKQKAIEKENELCYEIGEEVPRFLIGDQIRLLQILSNLTSNAIKFTENGKILIKISAEKNAEDLHTIRVEVIDNGIGISESNQKLLFNSFQQVDISTKKSFGGTGLGLVISRELCKKMNGDMGLFSKEGQGSTFWFTFEANEAKPEDITKSIIANTEITLTNYFSEYSPKILLVDDNAINRKVASEILLKASCTVTTADSGKTAIEIFTANHDFDLILMDIQMPEMDGIETTQKLKEMFGDILPKVVAMTAYSMQNDRENFLSKGLDDYVSKPIRANILVRKVEELVLKKTGTEQDQEGQTASTPLPEHSSEYSMPDDIPVFDQEVINSLKEMVGQEMLISVFEDFELEATEQIANTKAAFETNDVKMIQRELHTLKGNSGTIGLMRIHEVTKDIEVPAKTGNLENFQAKIRVLEEEFEVFKNGYKNL
jgi:PAS domain S-box-containing protein